MATTGKRPFRVLVADDDRDTADTLAMLLNLWGYDYRVCYDGAVALKEAMHYWPDCILLDLNMPGMNGYAVARRVRQMPELRNVQLVALSAYADETNIHEAGFDHHLVKPTGVDKLERLLRAMEEALHLVHQTEELAKRNVALASQAKEILQGAKEQLSEVKEELEQVTEEARELKQELRDVKEPPQS